MRWSVVAAVFVASVSAAASVEAFSVSPVWLTPGGSRTYNLNLAGTQYPAVADAAEQAWDEQDFTNIRNFSRTSAASNNFITWAFHDGPGGIGATGTLGCTNTGINCRMWVDAQELWYIGPPGGIQSNQRDLQSTITHEMGHFGTEWDIRRSTQYPIPA
jgi:hypothetical protein